MEERLNKIIAGAGLASRRQADELIAQGRVTIDGRTVTELGARVDPAKQIVRLDGERVNPTGRKLRYYVFNKPLNTITTMEDEKGRPSVGDYVEKIGERLFPAGRLDWDSEGLLILTNDGEFANQILHPSFEVPKIYEVKVKGKPTEKALEKVRTGMMLEDGPTMPAKVRVVKSGEKHDWLRVTVTEGRNRLVRRMFQRVKFPVQRLRRIGIGPLRLGRLKSGEWRVFSAEELAFVEALKRGEPIAEAPAAGKAAAPKRPVSRKEKARRGHATAKPRGVKPGYKVKQKPRKSGGTSKDATRRGPGKGSGRAAGRKPPIRGGRRKD